MQEGKWPGSAGGTLRSEFAGGGWECRSGGGLVVLEVLEGWSLLEGAGSAGVGVA